jgi:hypothetical protein
MLRFAHDSRDYAACALVCRFHAIVGKTNRTDYTHPPICTWRPADLDLDMFLGVVCSVRCPSGDVRVLSAT